MPAVDCGNAGCAGRLAMNYSEIAATFDCEGERLIGVVSVPERAAPLGVVVVVGGPQYRVGSHRQFVSLARRLAVAGYAVLRFDYRGMGDSTGTMRSFEDVTPDIDAAIGALRAACPAVTRIALWGLCDGASAMLLRCADTRDAQVAGIALLNPWVRSESTLAKTQLKHYYGRRLFSKGLWSKLARGGVDVAGALRSLASNARAMRTERQRSAASSPSFQDRMLEGLRAFDGAGARAIERQGSDGPRIHGMHARQCAMARPARTPRRRGARLCGRRSHVLVGALARSDGIRDACMAA